MTCITLRPVTTAVFPKTRVSSFSRLMESNWVAPLLMFSMRSLLGKEFATTVGEGVALGPDFVQRRQVAFGQRFDVLADPVFQDLLHVSSCGRLGHRGGPLRHLLPRGQGHHGTDQ